MVAHAEALSIIVVTWNSSDTIGRCLASARRSRVPHQLIVVDNHSADASVAIARRHADVVVENEHNKGFASAVNVAINRCERDLVLILNPDVTLERETIPTCIELLKHTNAGIVGANLRAPDGNPDRAAARRFKSVRTVLLETLVLPRVSPRFDWQYFPTWDRRDSREVPCVNGAFMLMRTDLLRELGGMDESVFMYLEDLDLCWRVRDRGLAIWFCADAIATHIGGASTAAGNINQQAIAHLHRLDGTIEFIRRTSWTGARPVVIILLMVQSLLGALAATASGDHVAGARHRRAVPWLLKQIVVRRPPPPVPQS